MGSLCSHAQILPRQDADLNFTQVMFEHPPIRNASSYIIQITSDTVSTAFTKPLMEIFDSFPATIVSSLQPGTSYQWRYCGIVKGRKTGWFGPYNFNVLGKFNYERYKNGVHILKNDSMQTAGGLIAIDALQAIFDRQGNVVWFMAIPGNRTRNEVHSEDLRITRAGTVTFLDGEHGRECDLYTRNRWVTPLDGTEGISKKFGAVFNHDIKRLANGHYMVIRQDCNWEKLPEQYNINNPANITPLQNSSTTASSEHNRVIILRSGNMIRADSVSSFMYVNTGAVVEYDKRGHIVWIWKAASYLDPRDIFVQGWTPDSPMVNHDPHMNGFSQDEKGEFVYVSFRNLDRIVKVEKNSGQVVNSWGTELPSGEARDGHGFFMKQHGVYIGKDDTLMLFNNNFANRHKEPSGIEMIEQGAGSKPSKIIWHYDCAFDSVPVENLDSRGGNVEILPNNNLLVCMGQINRVFEMTRDKKIVWSAVVETREADDSAWKALPLYRAHYSSSLYPCYFMAQTSADTLQGKQTGFSVKIWNAGTESDSYLISVQSLDGSYAAKFNSGQIGKRQSISVEIKPGKEPRHGEKIAVAVQSNTNQDLNKKMEVVYK